MVYPFGQHSVAFGYDVSYLPWQRRHLFGAATKRFTNGLTPNYGLPGGIPPDGIVGKDVRELIDARSGTSSMNRRINAIFSASPMALFT